MSNTDNYDDIFARIGQQAPKWGEGLCEHPPRAIPDRKLPIGAFQPVQDFAPLQKPSNADELRAGVNALREKAAPFLRNLASALESRRERTRITEADWRLVDRESLGQWQRICGSDEGWEKIRLPHYGGPVGPATAIYRSTVELSEEFLANRRVFLCFRGADYTAQVFLNGIFVMQHEGFFEPFEADVTALVRPGANTLVVRLDNEHPSFAVTLQKERVAGEKLYAATGLGWDDPNLGWCHCPPGMGIYQDVYFETRSALHLHDLWVRPLPESSNAEVRVTVNNCGAKTEKVFLKWKVCGSNFDGDFPQEAADRTVLAEPGMNEWRIPVSLPDFRWWTLESPWLYQAQMTLHSEDGTLLDTASSDFGMRTFRISDEGAEKGRLFFNGSEIRLRGANTMGHEQQCVFTGNLAQLHDDILIAKFAGLNFLRITQRPVQKEIYEACDRLGILLQTDLPLFGKLVRTKVVEGVRQAGAMERLIRPHACCVLVSFINEPSPSWTDTANKHLVRDEFLGFLRMCAEIVLYENPDRQIKPIDGDYEPPSPGLPDQHSYCGWYCGHGLDLGLLHRGHWMPTKPGWKYACGEFGIEGLDPVALMRRHYPASWLPQAGETKKWTPLRIPYAQTGVFYVYWMEAGDTIEEWVKLSQDHQAWAVRVMTRAFRRDSRMVSFALHLLIDAFPASWMKTVVDYERNPKPAYFEYRDALRPLLADIRCDRWAWWAGETLTAEAWVCHDGPESLENHTLRYVFEVNDTPVASGIAPARIPAWDSTCQGSIAVALPQVERRGTASLRMALCAPDGTVIHDAQESFSIFPKPSPTVHPRIAVVLDNDEIARILLSEFPHSRCAATEAEVIVSSHPGAFDQVRPQVEGGATLLLLQLPPGEYSFDGEPILIEKSEAGPRQFVSCSTAHPVVEGCDKRDFRWWFDAGADSVTALLDTVLMAAPHWTPILSAAQSSSIRGIREAFACAERKYGRGRVIVCQLHLTGRLAANPPAMQFLTRLLAGVP